MSTDIGTENWMIDGLVDEQLKIPFERVYNRHVAYARNCNAHLSSVFVPLCRLLPHKERLAITITIAIDNGAWLPRSLPYA